MWVWGWSRRMWTFQSHRWCLWRHNGGGVYEERAWKAPFHGLQTEDPCGSTLPQRLFRLWGNGGTGKYRNNKIQKIKNYKKQKYKSNRDKKTHYLRQDLVKRLCLANVALSFKLQPESEMGLSRSSNPQASDEAWFPHKSCHDIHYSASHRAACRGHRCISGGQHYDWEQHNTMQMLHFRGAAIRRGLWETYSQWSTPKHWPSSPVSTPALMAVTTGQCLIAITTAFWLGSFQDQKLTPKLGTHSFQAHCGLCINGMPLATLWLPGQCWLPISTVSCPHHNKARNLIKYP